MVDDVRWRTGGWWEIHTHTHTYILVHQNTREESDGAAIGKESRRDIVQNYIKFNWTYVPVGGLGFSVRCQ